MNIPKNENPKPNRVPNVPKTIADTGRQAKIAITMRIKRWECQENCVSSFNKSNIY